MTLRVLTILLFFSANSVCSDLGQIRSALVGRWICDETKTRGLNPEASADAMEMLLASETQWEFHEDGTFRTLSRLGRPRQNTVWRISESSDSQDTVVEVKMHECWIAIEISFDDGFLISRIPGAPRNLPDRPGYMAFRKPAPESGAHTQPAEHDGGLNGLQP